MPLMPSLLLLLPPPPPPPPVLLPAQALASLLCVSQGALYCLIIVAPLAAFQYQGYLTFCR